MICQAIKATFDRRKTAIPNSYPLALTAEFSEDKQKLTQWIAFLRKSNLDGTSIASMDRDLFDAILRLEELARVRADRCVVVSQVYTGANDLNGVV